MKSMMAKHPSPKVPHSAASADDNQVDSGVPSFVACGQSIALSAITGPAETKDESTRSPGRQADCDSSRLRWSNDPEKEYFQYVLQQEQERRAQQGKPEIDSLMGDSTIGEIIGNKAQQEPSVVFEGYSLATKELASNNHGANVVGTSFPVPEQSPPNNVHTFLSDAPSTICTWEQQNQDRPQKGDTARDNRQLYIIVGLAACLVVGCVTVVVSLGAMYIVDNTASLSMDTTEDLGFPAINSINFPTTMPSNRVEGEAWSTTTTPASAQSSLRPSSRPELNPIARPTPQQLITSLPTYAPTQDPMQSSHQPVASPTAVQSMPPIPMTPPKVTYAPTGNPVSTSPTRRTTLAPTRSPVSARPTEQPNRLPTHAPTASPVTDVPTFQPTTTRATASPTYQPTRRPSFKPTRSPTEQPTSMRPTLAPTPSPTYQPTWRPSSKPTTSPTEQPTTSSPTFAPTPSPVTAKPTEQPTRQPAQPLPPVQIVSSPPPTPRPANNAAPNLPANRLDLRLATEFPLRRCEGDCDTDSDCQQGLVCLQRNRNELDIPGCLIGTNDNGLERTNTDFCVPTPRPAWAANDLDLRFGLTFPLKQCEGDCDTDHDCQEGLVCLQRERGQVPIPGCLLGGNPDRLEETRTDFCVPENMRG